MANLELPDAEFLRKCIDFNPETGVLTWRDRPGWWWNKRLAGQVAGYVSTDGYRRICISNTKYLAHRLAWAIHYGSAPDEIDHINGNRADNRIENLRAVTRTENNMNSAVQSNSTTGVTGVTWDAQTGRWRATIKQHGRTHSLGRFADFDDAVSARKAAERRMGFHENHGRERLDEARLMDARFT